MGNNATMNSVIHGRHYMYNLTLSGIEYTDFNFEPREKITAIYMNRGRHDVARDEYMLLLVTTKHKEGIINLSQYF